MCVIGTFLSLTACVQHYSSSSAGRHSSGKSGTEAGMGMRLWYELFSIPIHRYWMMKLKYLLSSYGGC